MKTMTADKVRASLHQLLREMAASHEPIHITGKNTNAVLIAEEDWRAIRESIFTVTLKLPKRVYRRAQQAAEATRRPVEKLIVDALDLALPPIDDAPPEMADELAAMSTLPDKALWEIARSVMPTRQQARLRALSAAQHERALKPAEVRRLDDLLQEYGRVTLRKAHAYALLHKRGLYSPANHS